MGFLYQRIDHDDQRILDVYRLRYQVYCLECGFENSADFPEQMEKDAYDDASVHFGIFQEDTSDMIGTARLVLPSVKEFPIEKGMRIDPSLLPDFDRNRIGEISRLAISKKFRKRIIDAALYSEKRIDIYDEKRIEQRRKRFESQLVAGLYQCIYLESVKHGLTHWYAAMAKGLYFLLRRWGVVWQSIGPEMNYHGLRSAYISSIVENVAMAQKRYPAMLTKPRGWND